MSTMRADCQAHGYSYTIRKHRTKSDWAGISIGDAFKNNIEYYIRLSAQRIFYRTARRIQKVATTIAENGAENSTEFKVKPQLSPCYTTYPSNLAAYAAIGMTGYLEYKARADGRLLLEFLRSYLECPQEWDNVNVDPSSYQKVALEVTASVQERLFLEDLSRIPSMASVEIYRLFMASQHTMVFDTLDDIIKVVVLFGDVLPDWTELDIHPMTRQILEDLTEASLSYFNALLKADAFTLTNICVQWVRNLCVSISRYLPKPAPPKPSLETSVLKNENVDSTEGCHQKRYRFTNETNSTKNNDCFAPLAGPRPPSLSKPTGLPERIAGMIGQDKEQLYPHTIQSSISKDKNDNGLSPEAQAILKDFGEALNSAGGQNTEWEDMRSDLIEKSMKMSPFAEGPIQGSPTDGHEVQIILDGEKSAGGEIFDRVVELSDDLPACEKLIERSGPVSEALKRVLYPNIEQIPETERFCTGGSLDPSRLAFASFSQVVFKRYRIHDKADQRGRPVLVIACDGSGSLDSRQMGMLKVLSSAWLCSTVNSRIQVLAGLYHSGQVRNGMSGPLVQWMFHPQKTPSFGRRDAIRALVSLPDTGTGVQSDALSIAFMIEEAKRIARGRMIYLILLSDCRWNRSFNTEKTGREEVASCFKSAYEALGGKLHVTLVALGVDGPTHFEEQLDKVIAVSNEKLEDYVEVAQKIGLYVASCMKERTGRTGS